MNKYHARTVLSLLTGRLLTIPESEGGNGLSDYQSLMSDLLGWETYTHLLASEDIFRKADNRLRELFPELCEQALVVRISEMTRSIDRWSGIATKENMSTAVGLLTDKMIADGLIKEYYAVERPESPIGEMSPFDGVAEKLGGVAKT